MSLVQAYINRSQEQPRSVDRIVIAHFDAHGVSYASARMRVLQSRGEIAEVITKYPETGPKGLSDRSLLRLVEESRALPVRAVEVIDIPLDVRAPDISIKTLAELKEKFAVPLIYLDHHETDRPYISKLIDAGITPVVSDNITLACALELLNDNIARELAIIGMVADRDREVLRLVSRREVEQRYIHLANRLDVLVRSPDKFGFASLADLARRLATEGVSLLERTVVDYPPYKIAHELESKIVAEGAITVLVDWSDMNSALSMWAPKTLETLLLRRERAIAVAVTPAFDPKSKQLVGYDVRVLRYWLAENAPVPEEIVRDLVIEKAIYGQVVGHSDYVSLRYGSLDEARRVAEEIYKRVERGKSNVAQLLGVPSVAEAVQRDYSLILEELRRIRRALESIAQSAEKSAEALERGSSAKERQVQLLERMAEREQRVRYD